MKKLTYIPVIATILLAACKNQSPEQVKSNEIKEIVKTQPAGTIITADSILYDKLNNFYFTVIIKTTEASNKGTYVIETAIGPSVASAKFSMPHGAEDAIPIMHRIQDSTSFIIGFYYGNDTTFYDYYQVKAVSGDIEMQYIKAYRFN